MFCPGCSQQVNEDLKFCRRCGANLHGVREAMNARSTEGKPDWSNNWAANIALAQEIHERQRGTPEERRLNEIKGGVITSMVGLGLTIFLYFFLGVVAKHESPADAEILRNVWIAGIIPFLVGIGLIINGVFISRRLVKLKEQQTQAALSVAPASLLGQTTSQLDVGVIPSAGYSVVEDTTVPLPKPVTIPSRPENT